MNDTIWIICLIATFSALFWGVGYMQGRKHSPLHRTIAFATGKDGDVVAITSDAFTEAEMERIRLTLKAARESGELPPINSVEPDGTENE